MRVGVVEGKNECVRGLKKVKELLRTIRRRMAIVGRRVLQVWRISSGC
jgi:hypothetical protein